MVFLILLKFTISIKCYITLLHTNLINTRRKKFNSILIPAIKFLPYGTSIFFQ